MTTVAAKPKPETVPAAPTPMSPGKRIFNFSAGPAVLPEEVLHQCQQDIWNIFDSGIGIMEHSHRGPVFDRVIDEAKADCRTIASISDEYEVLFLQGGASTQFGMIPMNFLPKGATADYPDTGVWTTKAIKEAKLFGNVNVAFEGGKIGYAYTPSDNEMRQSPNAAYLHYCSNNTIYGTRYPKTPASASPLIADTSSEMFARPIEIDKHAMIYAGAQKNLGPSGVVLVIIRKDFMERSASVAKTLPSMSSYINHAKNDSRLNTPPAFGIYVMGQVFKWILKQGGLQAIEKANASKAKLIYDAIDGSGGFYKGVARPDCRSHMNVTFRSPSEDLDKKFVTEAAKLQMDGLKGHRDAGGMRASIYNAFPIQGCKVLADFMNDFAAKNG